ncbi:amino acid ABC transporter substrate-binding protein [Methylobacterium tardum]|uniref:amino acid ABC transporter substrate-binding protein n=1 Tax=Methylobacterium tardum TaxID=374432 RepID=UPI00202273C1|nr:amino acid ABC transporter substrate-binding protein [Methylobacterium tardum]URD37062.1 amino acid ABC transporter substrate-binding protein [Methylobacterium tardum]
MSRTLSLVIAALCCVGITAPVSAEGRLDKIRSTGQISLGFPDASPPFGFLDQNAKPVGYSLEICEHVAEKLKTALGLTRIDIRHVPVMSATRIPLINNGTIDLECGTASNLPERHKLVSFAPTTFVAQVVLVAKKDAPVDVGDIASFRRKAISAQAGGETQRVATRINVRDKLDIQVMPAKDTAEVFLLVETGRAAGAINDDALAHATVAGAKRPGDYKIGTKGLEFAPYGILEPKDDAPFKAAVDKAVVELIQDGTVARLYARYFEQPIPPKGINLELPMSDVLTRALANPTDSGDEAAYR